MNEEFKAFEAGWPGNETVCGWGSTVENTRDICRDLPNLIKGFGIKSMNDAGCGDLNWIRHIDFHSLGVKYVGYDLYERESWKELRQIYDGTKFGCSNPKHDSTFCRVWDLRIADITTTVLPPADLVMCRDVMIHLPNYEVMNVIENLRKSHSYLLATSFTSPGDNDADYSFCNEERIREVSMKHSKLDLRLPPFNLGQPIAVTVENYPYKTTSLWNLSQV